MDIGALEQRYQLLLSDFQAGRLDAASFAAAVDHLSFQDRWGRYWMIGAQSGSWYYFDGRAWHAADPRRIEPPPGVAVPPPSTGQRRRPPERFPAAPLLKIPLKMMGLLGLAFVVVLTLLAWPVSSAPPLGGPLADPSPRPPADPVNPGEGGGGGDDNDDGGSRGSGSGPHSAIFGNIVDLSTDRPGAGLEVSVNGAIVRSNTEGYYSITGLSGGEYTVALALSGQGVPAHGPVFVNLDGRNPVTVDLAYYTQTPLPTDTPQAPALVSAEPPPSLPDSGAPISSRMPLWLMAGGLLLTLAGAAAFYRKG